MPLPHVCRDGGAGAVVRAQKGALETWACSSCGAHGSSLPCEVGKPHADATGDCRDCGRWTCDAHRSQHGNLCDRCRVKRLKPAPRRPIEVRVPYADR